MTRSIGIYYEHSDSLGPLFAELDRRGTPYARLDATRHHYGAAEGEDSRFGLVFNRMSPSAHLRGHAHSILYTLSYLAHLEQQGVRVVNGLKAFRIETSKALQLSLLRSLGLPFPATRVINHPDEAPAAAAGLRFPVVVKPNIGGSGAGIVRFDSAAELHRAVDEGQVRLGLDQTGLVQELIPAADGHITRVEVLGGRHLYAIHVSATASSFDHVRVEAYTPPASAIDDVERIMAAARIEVGGVEYVVDARDGRRYYYDINALSNFVTDAPRVVAVDPVERLADFLELERDLAAGTLGVPRLPDALSEGLHAW
jgi:glutathione synthase/RimK-type ligase-like ATP-grasp enzyme